MRFSFAILIIILIACGSEQIVPKPVGYFRIDLPKPTYQAKSLDCPFSFEISKYSRLEIFPDSEHPCWFNLSYPELNAKIHFTYRHVDGDLRNYLEESRGLAFEHQIKANRISTKIISNDSTQVYGLIYDLGGNVASPYQFYLTDSITHFLRGSLYFEAKPNPDSLKPSLAFVENDMAHFISSFTWKD